MTALASEALRLPATERLKLIEEVWDSLAAEPSHLPISGAEIDELERRRSRYLANPHSLIDWEGLKRQIGLKD
jgi:putative addiction module component (TIGR02574 family)